MKVPGTKAPVTGEALRDLLRAVSEAAALISKFRKRGVPAPLLLELLRTKFRGTKRGVGHAEIARGGGARGGGGRRVRHRRRRPARASRDTP